ncbi:adenylyltransferase and sulfurtransferase MOCS3-like [Oscarella lobularis]|uniref:adenylyltransferase and sulfurtransferase MOCS3-like n=1 Tax=Oscarella lobularis TaxID=121494 RepID=UPI00331363AF
MEERVRQLEEENRHLKQLLSLKERREFSKTTETGKLSNEEIARYGRQLILPEFGVKGQVSLKSSSALVVGAGGLGCPASLYLAGAGIGRLGLIDYDEVELGNLHRQIIHSEDTIGVAKVLSASSTLTRLNSLVECIPYKIMLDSLNALSIIEQYDIVLDATDNVATRYLLNDACVLLGKPLVSGSALRFEGQLTTYNYEGGPCYRCLFPKPPPPETVTNCSDGGVLGVIPGVIGCLQAMEAISILSRKKASYSKKLLLFDGAEGSFRVITLRPKQKGCPVCGESPSVTQLVDYVQFCGSSASDKAKTLNLLPDEQRLSCKEYSTIRESLSPHILLDVREPSQYEICSLPNSINIPLKDLQQSQAAVNNFLYKSDDGGTKPIYVICQRGNDSQLAVDLLHKATTNLQLEQKPKDIKGGLQAWAKEIDPTFPTY